MCKKIFILLLLLLSFSCGKKNGGEILLDNSDPLALAPDIRWAVVSVPYAAFRQETSWDAQTVSYCKQGEVFPVLASSAVLSEGKTEMWYRFEEGWLPAPMISVYPNKLRALKVSGQLK